MRAVVVFGGTGYIGRAVVERYLSNGCKVVVISRLPAVKMVSKKLLAQSMSESFLHKHSNNGTLCIVCNISFDEDSREIVEKVFQKASSDSIVGVINLTVTSTAEETLRVTNKMLQIFKQIKLSQLNIYLCSVGSTSEGSSDKATAPYESAKILSGKALKGSCSLYITVGYVIGKGNSRLMSDANKLHNLLKISRKWLFGFDVSYIAVNDLADIIFELLEGGYSKLTRDNQVLAFATNGEAAFGDILKTFLPAETEQPKPLLRGWLEKAFLRSYSAVMPIVCPSNQFIRRVASFAKRASANHRPHFTSSYDIKNMANTSSFIVLKKNSDLVVLNDSRNELYVFRDHPYRKL